MKWINMVVEGKTELAFARKVLAPYLLERGIKIRECPILGKTVNIDRMKQNIVLLLKRYAQDACSTMFDFYGLSPDFPGKKQASDNKDSPAKAKCVESALVDEIRKNMSSSFDPRRFIPYVQMHEFEGLLFSDPAVLAKSLGKPELRIGFSEIRQSFDTPEDINDTYDTAPSRRIRGCYPRYDKIANGISAAQEIGLGSMRKECPHFSAWVAKLESLRDKA
jgi:hypothetical protein